MHFDYEDKIRIFVQSVFLCSFSGDKNTDSYFGK